MEKLEVKIIRLVGAFKSGIEQMQKSGLRDKEIAIFDNAAEDRRLAEAEVEKYSTQSEREEIKSYLQLEGQVWAGCMLVAEKLLGQADVAETRFDIEEARYFLGSGWYQARMHDWLGTGEPEDGSLREVVRELSCQGIRISWEECIDLYDCYQQRAISNAKALYPAGDR